MYIHIFTNSIYKFNIDEVGHEICISTILAYMNIRILIGKEKQGYFLYKI